MGKARKGFTILLSSAVFGIAVVLAVGGTAYAVSGYLNAFRTAYPAAVGTRIDVCELCHPTGAGARNAYGNDFANANIGNHTFNATLGLADSDGDFIPNDAEIAAFTFPGDANDPAPTGDPNIAVSPASVALEVVVNDNASRVVTISNTGDAVLNVSSIALDAGTDFTLDLDGGTCGVTNPTIGVGDNCTVAVVFAPLSVGAINDNLAIASNDPDQPTVNVALSGTGLDNVTPAVTSATGTGTITLDTSGNPGTSFSGVMALLDTDPSLDQTGKPAGFTFPDGLVAFQVAVAAPGDNAGVTITFPSAIPAGAKYYKVGATGFSEFAGAVIAGNTVTLNLQDGGSGDTDGAADGVITDPGGVGIPAAVPPPPSGGGGGGCSIIGSDRHGGGGAVLFLTLVAILVALRRQRATAGR